MHRIAIIGIGAVADVIASAVKELPNAQLVAGSCRTRNKGDAFAQKFGCKWYAQTEEMLTNERPEVAIIATPSGVHLDSVLLCAKHKVHVLCEKPLEISTSRIDQMIASGKQAGITIGAFFPQRFNPVVAAIQQQASAGRFGNLSVISAAVPWWRDDQYYGGGRWQGTQALDGGGALMNQAIHYVDLLQWLAGSTMPDLDRDVNPVAEIFAFTAKRAHDEKIIEVEDTAVACLRFRNGALGQMLGATSMFPGSLRHLQIAGRNGMLHLREDELLMLQFRDEQAGDETLRQRFAKKTQHQGGAHDPMAFSHRNHKGNIADFLSALERKVEPTLSAREARKAVAIVEACYESARTGQMIRI